MKVLITGGAGFIGSDLADRLLYREDNVVVIDNFKTGRRDNLTPHDNLTLIEDTIENADMVNRIFDEFQPDKVVHAACSYKDPDDWEEDIKTNIVGTLNVIRASQKYGIKQIIYYQTALRYGLHPVEQPITLNHPVVAGGSSYAVSKTSAEQYIEISGLNHTSFVLANAYGPRNISGPLPTFFHRLTNNKPCFVMDTRRDFIYVSDLIDITVMALDGKGGKGAYHVSSGTDYAIKELFDATIKAMAITLDQDVEVRDRNPDDVYTILLNPSKTIKDFGWQVSTPLEEGVMRAVAYYREYGITETYTHLKLGENE